ncbi:MAG: pantoate--beta-alanine ligase [Bacteroidales bacterium]|jgi:pantoate--beta-alanine ligase|nr:pantoate--beta-alanine ligase [Bacteroidales bacterium]
MKVTDTIKGLRKHISDSGLSPLALVPTMGALHNGHISLVEKAVGECPITVVSIFVNPTQFNDKNDLKNYPRTLEKDLEMLGKVLGEHDVVFTPPVEEMYPEEDRRVFTFGNLDNVMEAVHRPGHFNGVAQIVSRLFEIVAPDIAIFGLKDFQQLAVIRELVKQTGNKVRIIGSPIIREKDGLAMSSRNMLLEPAIRKDAAIIYKTITSAAAMLQNSDIPETKQYVKNEIEKPENFELIYFEIVDDEQLIPIKSKREMNKNMKYFGCIAVKAGNIRLIDNVEI